MVKIKKRRRNVVLEYSSDKYKLFGKTPVIGNTATPVRVNKKENGN